MKTMRVLHIYRTYFPETQGGAQEAIRQFCLATREFGVQNSVFALAHEPLPQQISLPEGQLIRSKSLIEIASCDFGGFDAIRRCRAAACAADVIQIYYPWPFADLMLPFIRQGKPVIVTYMSDIVRQAKLDLLYGPLRTYLLGSADVIAATSPTYARTSEVLQRYPGKVRAIPHCLSDAPASDPAVRARWAQRLGDDFFLFVGVLRYYKGLEFLIRAANHVDRPIAVVGDGPERANLEALVASLGVSNVHFLGALPDEDKFALNDLCRAVVFPSHLRSEAFGITLLEAARAGKPMISCEIGTGTSWVNLDGETGLVVPPADPAALAGAMQKLATDDGLCRRLGAGAQQRWREVFSPAVVGRTLRDLYDELCR